SRDQRFYTPGKLRPRDDVLAVAEQSALDAARTRAIDLEFVLAALELFVLTGGLAVHFGLSGTRAAAAFDTVRVTSAVDAGAAHVALAVTGGLAALMALRRIGRALAFRVAGAAAFAEAVVLAGDADAAV